MYEAALLVLVLALLQSPYAGQESRDIKALSPEEVAGYLAGEGMGFAKAAELNGYPGPKHALELAEPLELSEAQLRDTRRIFEAMRQEARSLGEELVRAERRLDAAFAEASLDSARLEALVDGCAGLQGRLRAVHLAAHLEMRALLTDEQRERYAALRGYAAGGHHHRHH